MDKIEQAIELYKGGMPLLDAWKATGCGRNKLQSTLKERGLMRSNKQNSRRHSLNDSFFETIDTEEKAYWLGFIYADGYVSAPKSRNQKSIGIALGVKDKSHIEKFRDAINATYEVKDYESSSYGTLITYSRLWMTSDKMFNDLVEKGVSEHKTLTLTFPNENIVPKHLQRHFVRGYFDGDGSFAFDGNNHYRIKIEGTKEFLVELSKVFGYPVDEDKLYRRHKDKDTSRTLEYHRVDDVRQIAKFMYEDATVYLDRKYERYIQTQSH